MSAAKREKKVERINVAEFARRKKVSTQSVQKAIGNGRIERGPDKLIEWPSQSVAWEANRDQQKVRAQGTLNAGQDGAAASSLMRARTVKENFTALRAELEYKRASGKLIERELVSNAVFVFTRFVRDAIMGIPERVAAEAAARMIGLMIEAAGESLSEKAQEKMRAALKVSEIERIMRDLWSRESRTIMEEVARGPTIE